MKNLFKQTIWLFALPLLLGLFTTTYAKDSSIVIFDASGSMKKQIDGKPKFEIANEVMSNLIQNWNEDIDLGLMVYGHRSKACDDIEMVIPIGKPDADKFLSAIKGINPKGETPIAESMKQAAEKLNYEESPTTVILISDGEESCNADPCAMAKQLEKSGTDFTAHVIGFDVSGDKQAKALEQLKCVSENTGGKFIEAKDSKGLKEALVEMAKVVAEPEPKPEPEKKTVKVSNDTNLPFSDDFERDELGDNYEVESPDADRMAISDGQLLILTTDPEKNKIVVKQKISGNFEATVKVTMNLTNKNYVSLQYHTGKKNSVRIAIAINKEGCHIDRLRPNRWVVFKKTLNDKSTTRVYSGKVGKRKVPIACNKREGNSPQEDWYFKIKKKGFKLQGYASIDGKEWTKIGEHALIKKEGYIALRAGGKGVEDPILFDDLHIKAID